MKVLKIILVSLLIAGPAFAENIIDISSEGEVGTLVQNYYYNYGGVRIFDRARAVFTLRNDRRIPIYINDIRLTGDNVFYADDNCPRLLFQGDRCRIRVFFEPRRLLQYRGALEIQLTPTEDIRVHLRGRGVLRVGR